MGKLLEQVFDMNTPAVERFYFWCPGCAMPHAFWVGCRDPLGDKRWSFDGDWEKPTFTPDLLIVTCKSGRCHLDVSHGEISYRGDSRHELAGKTVPMVARESIFAGPEDDV